MLTEDLSVFTIPLDFSCTILNDNRLITNIYNIRISADPVEDTAENIGIGFQRVKHLAEYHLQNSIFLEKDDKLFKELDSLENNIVCLPCEAYDIYVGSILMAKFQAITEKYFDIQHLTIASLLGDQVQFNIISPYDANLDIEGDHWWNQDNVYTGSKTAITWDELNLTEVPKFRPTVVKGGLSEN